jgi:hypothetical protein
MTLVMRAIAMSLRPHWKSRWIAAVIDVVRADVGRRPGTDLVVRDLSNVHCGARRRAPGGRSRRFKTPEIIAAVRSRMA